MLSTRFHLLLGDRSGSLFRLCCPLQLAEMVQTCRVKLRADKSFLSTDGTHVAAGATSPWQSPDTGRKHFCPLRVVR